MRRSIQSMELVSYDLWRKGEPSSMIRKRKEFLWTWSFRSHLDAQSATLIWPYYQTTSEAQPSHGSSLSALPSLLLIGIQLLRKYLSPFQISQVVKSMIVTAFSWPNSFDSWYQSQTKGGNSHKLDNVMSKLQGLSSNQQGGFSSIQLGCVCWTRAKISEDFEYQWCSNTPESVWHEGWFKQSCSLSDIEYVRTYSVLVMKRMKERTYSVLMKSSSWLKVLLSLCLSFLYWLYLPGSHASLSFLTLSTLEVLISLCQFW